VELEGGRKYTAMWLDIFLGFVLLTLEVIVTRSLHDLLLSLFYFGALADTSTGGNAFVERASATGSPLSHPDHE
jgi:hypothetical protein